MNLTFQQHQISIRKAEKEKLLGMGRYGDGVATSAVSTACASIY